MAVEIGALRALLSLDSAAFERGAKRAQASMSTLQRSLAQSSAKMQAAGKKLTLGVTAPLAGMTTVLVKSSLTAVDAQAKLAQSLGTTVASVQTLERAGDLAGVSMSGIEQATKDLTRRMSQAATGTGPAVDALDRLGLSAVELMKMPLDRRVAEINTAIDRFVPVAERAAVAGQLFGEEGSIAMARIDAATLDRAAAEINRFGVAVSEVDADAIEDANDAMSALGLVTRGLGNQLAVALAPTLKVISERIADVAAWFSALSPRTKQFMAAAAALAAALGPVLVVLGLVAGGLSAISAPLLVVGAVAAVAAGAIAVAWSKLSRDVDGSSGVLQSAAAGLRSAWQAIPDFLAGVGRSTDEISSRLGGAGQSIGRTLELIADGIRAIGGAFGQDVDVNLSMKGAADALGTFAGYVGVGIAAMVEGVAGAIRLLAESLKFFYDMGASTRASLTGFIRALQDGVFIPDWMRDGLDFTGALSAVDDFVSSSIDKFSAWTGAAYRAGLDLVMGIARGIKEGAGNVIAAIESVSAEIWESLKSWPSRAVQSGRDFIAGLVRGLRGADDDVVGAAEGVGASAVDAIEEAWDIQSPSRVAAGLGAYFTEGLAVGIDQAGQQVIIAAEELTARVAATVETGFSGIGRGISDAIATGLTGGGFDGLKSTITGALKSSVSGAIASGFGGKGILGGLLGGIGGLGTAFGAGFKSVMGASSLSAGFGAIGTALGGATSGLTGLATAAGALAGPVGLAAVAIKGLIGSKKELDRGLRITVTEMDAAVDVFRKVEKSKLFGLFKSRSTSTSPADEATRRSVQTVVTGALSGVRDAAESLGRTGLDDFGASFRLSTKGMSPEQAMQAVQEELAGLADTAAQHLVPEIDTLAREGETAAAALGRLVATLPEVNAVLASLDRAGYDASVSGAKAAAELEAAAGGLDALRAGAGAYAQGFFSEQERTRIETERLTGAMEGLFLVMPRTRAEFRAMVEAQDLTTRAGRETYGALLSVAGAMAEVLPAAEAAATATERLSQAFAGQGALLSRIEREIAAQVDFSREAIRSHTRIADLWRRTADGLRGLVQDIRTTSLGGLTGRAGVEASAMRYADLVRAVRAGDAEAGAAIPQAAKAYLDGMRSLAKTEAEYRVSAARVAQEVGALGTIADLQGQRHDVIVGLHETTIDVLGGLGNYLDAVRQGGDAREALGEDMIAQVGRLAGITGGGLDKIGRDFPATVTAFRAALGGVSGAVDRVQSATLGKLERWFADAPDVDPSDSFRAYLDGALKYGVADPTGELEASLERVRPPMGKLTDALGELRAAVLEDIRERGKGDASGMARIEAALERQALASTALAARSERDAAVARAQSVVAQIRDLEARTGARIVQRSGLGVSYAVDKDRGVVADAAAGVRGDRDALAAFRSEFWNKGGLQDQLWAASRAIQKYDAQADDLFSLARRLRIPGFASGGVFGGGAALVGERGPELVSLPPSRIHSAPDTRAIMAGDQESKQLLRDIKELLRSINREGVKQTREAERARIERGLRPGERIVT